MPCAEKQQPKSKLKPVVPQPAVDEDSEEETKPPSPPHVVVVKTAKPTKKKLSHIKKFVTSSRPTQSQILAEKMRIGASIIPSAVRVRQYTHVRT